MQFKMINTIKLEVKTLLLMKESDERVDNQRVETNLTNLASKPFRIVSLSAEKCVDSFWAEPGKSR